jgi:hypothetical protein
MASSVTRAFAAPDAEPTSRLSSRTSTPLTTSLRICPTVFFAVAASVRRRCARSEDSSCGTT